MMELAEYRVPATRCESGGAPSSTPAPHDTARIDDDIEKRPLRCRVCGARITVRSCAIAIRGGHTHVFTNPAGITFEIGCFSRAPGCALAGTPTTEYTWFPGHAWSLALCGECFNHLGWHYEAGGTGFFGLILEMLSE